MGRRIPYQEHLPDPALRRYVACYWSIRCRGMPAAATEDAVVPDACLDFLFDLTEHRASVVGTMTRPLSVRRVPTMDLLGVRFRPAGVGAFLRIPAAELTDGIAPLGAAWGRDADRLCRRLCEAVRTVGRVAVLDAVLLDRLGTGPAPDRTALRAAGLIEAAEGRIRVEHLARAAALGRRQFERRFLAAAGIAPKVACRVVRFQGALRRLHADRARSLASVAIASGYHDQAHLTREFAALAGVPPGAYRAARAPDG